MAQNDMTADNIEKLALYHMPYCPYCGIVSDELQRLNVKAENRDTSANAKHRGDLIAKRNRATVPVLRIYFKDGSEEWMPESRDIVKFLRASYG